MVEHVGGLGDEAGAVALDGGDRRLDRLLAELLRRAAPGPSARSFAV